MGPRPAIVVLLLLALLAGGGPAGAPDPAAAARPKTKPVTCKKPKVRSGKRCVTPPRCKKPKVRRGLKCVRRAPALSRPKRPTSTTQPGSGPDPAPAARVPDPVDSRTDPLVVGINANTSGWGDKAGAEQDKVRELGIGWLREELSWDVIEPARGRFEWAHFDALFAAAADRGLRILPVLIETPPWAGATWNTIPADPANYARYTAAVVGRYGPGGAFWAGRPDGHLAPEYFELWNEPWLGFFSATGVDPARYARLVRAASIAARAINPRAKFLLSADFTGLPGNDTFPPWIAPLFATVPDLAQHFDGVAVHPYADDADSYSLQSRRFDFGRLGDIHAEFAALGAGDKPLWITEVGWSTCTNGHEDCYSEAYQARELARTFALVRGRYAGIVGALFTYHLRDRPGETPAVGKEAGFGLLRGDESRKPAWAVVQRATAGD